MARPAAPQVPAQGTARYDRLGNLLASEVPALSRYCLTAAQYLSLLTGGAASCRFLLPLCGKAPDLLHLYKLGHTVTGVEGVATVAEQFFTENNLEYDRIALSEVQGSTFQVTSG